MYVHVSKIGEVLYDGDATELLVPGSEGDMTILPNHEPLVSLLRKGTVTVRGEEEKSFDIEDGMLEVSANQAIVLL